MQLSSGGEAHVGLVCVVLEIVEEVCVRLGLLVVAPLVQLHLVSGLQDVGGVVCASGGRGSSS